MPFNLNSYMLRMLFAPHPRASLVCVVRVKIAKEQYFSLSLL